MKQEYYLIHCDDPIKSDSPLYQAGVGDGRLG